MGSPPGPGRMKLPLSASRSPPSSLSATICGVGMGVGTSVGKMVGAEWVWVGAGFTQQGRAFVCVNKHTHTPTPTPTNKHWTDGPTCWRQNSRYWKRGVRSSSFTSGKPAAVSASRHGVGLILAMSPGWLLGVVRGVGSGGLIERGGEGLCGCVGVCVCR